MAFPEIYKARAECEDDVRRVKAALTKKGWVRLFKVLDDGDEIEFELHSEQSLATLVDFLNRHVVDSHVVADTLEPIALYTGERKYRY